jgi:hypothetical protein
MNFCGVHFCQNEANLIMMSMPFLSYWLLMMRRRFGWFAKKCKTCHRDKPSKDKKE